MGKIHIRPSDLVQEILYLDGKPFNIKDYPYLPRIYNTKAREVGLFTGRQVSKSTFLSSKLVGNAFTQPGGRQVLVSPLQEQAYVFSMQRLREFIHDSPVIKNSIFTGPNCTDQVLRKVFNNGHMITLGYAQRTADRLRGQSIKDHGVLGFDEIQDILPEVIPVVKEMAFRAKGVTYLYCGTPKSYANHMEKFRERSTSCEWAVKCHHSGCGYWNLDWDERNIGNEGVVCASCQKPIDTNQGEWVRRREMDLHKGKDARVTMEAFRISQLIVKPIMDDPLKWRELLDKLNSYSSEKFSNEVLGLPFDSASQPVTRDQVERCCDPERPNVLPDPKNPRMAGLCMGLDWALIGENSYTFVTIGKWRSFPTKFDVFYTKRFSGNEADPEFQIQWIIKTARALNIKLIGADWGVGMIQNIQLVNALGEESVVQLWHTSRKGVGGAGQRAVWHAKSRKWHLARTRVLTDTFEMIKNMQVVFPRKEESEVFIKDILAEQLELREETGTLFYTNVEPDDGLHSLTFLTLAAELYIRGDFGGHAGTDSGSETEDDTQVYDDVEDLQLDAHLYA